MHFKENICVNASRRIQVPPSPPTDDHLLRYGPGSGTRCSVDLFPVDLHTRTHTPIHTRIMKSPGPASGGSGGASDGSSPSHLLVRRQLLLQLPVLVVPHQIVDRIATLLRSFLSRNHPRIIACPLHPKHTLLSSLFNWLL